MNARKIITSLLVFSLLLFFLVSCSTGSDKGTVTLENTRWSLDELRAPGGKMLNVIDDTTITALFVKGTLSGNDGCNQYNASYTVNGDQVFITPGISTMMACPDEVMTQAQIYIQNLADTDSYRVDGNNLELFDKAGNVLLNFSEQKD